MKRFTVMILLLCMLLTALPAMADNVYYGNMEVINCNEWVSLRETPSTRAKQLVKVPLGAVVTDCQQYGENWIYAVYEDDQGYIQAKYLRQCEGLSVYSAMLISDWTDYYEAMGDLAPAGAIPPNTIVRNCAVHASGRAYVEYYGYGVYVDAGLAVPYNELSHFPQEVSLHYNYHIFDEAYTPPALALDVAYAEDFDLSAYDYTTYDYTEFEPVDEDTPKVHYVLYADSTVRHVHLFSVSIQCVNAETGEETIRATLENIQYEMDPEHPLAVTAVMYGDMPNLAVGYEDQTGAYHFAFVDMSGEDGSLYLNEF